MNIKSYDKGAVIFRQGDPGDCMYDIQISSLMTKAQSFSDRGTRVTACMIFNLGKSAFSIIMENRMRRKSRTFTLINFSARWAFWITLRVLRRP